MRITQLETEVLRLPPARPLPPSANGDRGEPEPVFLLVVAIDTDAGHRGLGFAISSGGGRALRALAEDDLAPLLTGEDPLDHERLGAKVFWRLQGLGRGGLLAHAYSAVDLALWDLKGKAAGLPLYKLLGGARESTPLYAGDIGWLWMSPEEIVEAARPYLDQGILGIKVQAGSPDPEADADRVTRVREALGEDVWLAVDANQRYDYGTALSMGHFFEEEIGADWFEEPIPCEDVEGYARLAAKLEIALAVGATLSGVREFHYFLQANAADVLQPDLTRVGGLTAWLKVAALAGLGHRPVAPPSVPEVAVHLACGLPQVRMVEYSSALAPAFVETPAIVEGRLVPPHRPGLGLEIRMEAVEKYRVET
jgi:L-alanine-DL-glutamate epimerase-like enolase superfamily enzyme